jgi:hypothetical protein
MEDVYYARASHHGEDFKRCDLMFTPVVNSIMMTCATEQAGQRIKSTKPKSDPPAAPPAIPFTELTSEMRKLQQKRCKVNHSDKKNNRTNAMPSKATFELKQYLEKGKVSEERSSETPLATLLMTPTKSPRPSSGYGTMSKKVTQEPTTPLQTSSTPRPRRPQTSQQSRYLSTPRRVQLTATEQSDETQNSSPKTSHPFKREESRGIDESLLQQSDDSSGDDKDEVFDTFNLRGVYRMKKRGALLGVSSDQVVQKPPQLRRSPTFGRQSSQSFQQTPQYTIPPSVSLTEKEAYTAKIASQFLSNVLRKKPLVTSILPVELNLQTDPDPEPDPPQEEIQPELLRHLFPAQPQPESEDKRKRLQYLSHLSSKKGPVPFRLRSTSRQKEVSSRPPAPIETADTGDDAEEAASSDDHHQWLEKRMKALLADYQAGEKTLDPSLVDEDTRKAHEARTISIEISLLFRGFQTIGPSLSLSVPLQPHTAPADKNRDGFLSGHDIISFCQGGHQSGMTETAAVTKSEITNVLWLMDDNRSSSLSLFGDELYPAEEVSSPSMISFASICASERSFWRALRTTSCAWLWPLRSW